MRRAWRFYWGHRRALFLAWLAAAALFTWMNASAWNAYHAAEEEFCHGRYGRIATHLVDRPRMPGFERRLWFGPGSFRYTELWMSPFDPLARYIRCPDQPGGSIRIALTREGWKVAAIVLDGELFFSWSVCIRLWPF